MTKTQLKKLQDELVGETFISGATGDLFKVLDVVRHTAGVKMPHALHSFRGHPFVQLDMVNGTNEVAKVIGYPLFAFRAGFKPVAAE